MYHTFNFDFNNNTSIFNTVSKAVLPAQTAADIFSHEDIGKVMYQSFIDKKIKGEVSIWSKMKNVT